MYDYKKYFRIKNYIQFFSLEGRVIRCIRDFSSFPLQKRKRAVKFLSKNTIYLDVNTKIGTGLVLPHPHNIQFGMGAIVGDNVTIYQNVTIGQYHGKYPLINNNVIIYPGACIFGGIIVGENSIIGAGAIVNKDVPANVVVAGNPAKVIREIEI